MKKIIALRHGERADRAPTRREVRLSFDPCMTEKGLLQAQESSERIMGMISPDKSVYLLCSPFLRCLETAGYIARALGIPIHIDNGFSEFLLDFDFKSSPMRDLDVYTRGISFIEEELGVKIIENQHLPGAEYPEAYETGKTRIRNNWNTFFPQIKEDIIIIVSHLFVVGALTEVWLGTEYKISLEGYCKITSATYENSTYTIDLLADHSHATQ